MEDSDTEEYILETDCEKFDVLLNFSRMIIKVLGKNFINTPLITCLNFEGNHIESVESGAFNNVPALQYLNIGNNSISSLFSFNGHDNLKTLILAHQSRWEYYERNLEIIGEYPELRYLDLSGNKISSINWPTNYQDSYNQINKKSAFPKLKYLDLSYNKLHEFHVSYDKLDNNNLVAINEFCSRGYVCISEMPRLKYFSISNNKINSLSRYVFMNIPELITLDLSNNELKDISAELFYNLNSLENFVIWLPRLSVLSIAHNEIQEIDPEEIFNAHALKKLYLDHNAIENIHESTFSKLESLEELYLDNNNLAKFPTEWDNNLRNLHYLNLSNNKFLSLESLSLSASLPVIRIDLINNNLIHITKILTNFIFPSSYIVFIMWHSSTFIIHVVVISMGFIQGMFATTISFRSEEFEEDLSLNFEEPMDKCDNPKHEIVKLANMGLRVVRDNFVESVNVRSINLENNDIVDISPDAFKGVPNLSCLNFRRNNRSNILNNFIKSFNHSSLTKLNLAETLSSSLVFDKSQKDYSHGDNRNTPSKSAFPYVTHLDISKNNLISLPNYVVSLFPHLTHLYLSDNKLDLYWKLTVPATTQVLYLERNSKSIDWSSLPRNISALFLNENYIQYNSYYESPNLKRLNLRGNHITIISKSAFMTLKKLEKLDLAENNLTTLPVTWMNSLTELRYLNLKSNFFTSIDSMSIYGYSNLNHLFVQNNSFIQIEIKSLEKLPSTVVVHVSSINNFTCTT
ncbi:protein artichoke-like [Vespula maculifrons]|uniref:Protein artichoke-like n=1 Tax=Vespula maculifrons TaxID=7453 RepID=A0ABD2CSW8_VESMC